MRIALLMILALLAGCNGSSDNDSALQQQISAIPNEATAIQAMRAQIDSLQSRLNNLQLIGKLKTNSNNTSPDAFRTMGEFSQAIPINFGPCSNLGVLIGRGSPSVGQDPLSSNFEAFQQCTGYEYTIDTSTDNVAVAPRIFWDGPNCTGNIYEWNSGGGAYNNQVLENGVVFLSPVDGQEYMIKAGQTPQQIQFQSVWVSVNPGCQSDIETHLLYSASINDVSITGIPNNAGGQFQLASP